MNHGLSLNDKTPAFAGVLALAWRYAPGLNSARATKSVARLQLRAARANNLIATPGADFCSCKICIHAIPGDNNANRLTGLTQGAASVGLTYDTANRRSTLTLPSGIVANYAYDNASQLTGITYMNGATTVGDLTYTYNNLGQRVAQGGSLLNVTMPGTISATYDNVNRLQSYGPYNATFSHEGSLTDVVVGIYSNHLDHDERGRLIHFTNDGTPNADYVYDALNRRIGKTRYDNNGLPYIDMKLLYDGWQAVQEQDSSGTVTANLLTGLGLDEIYRRSTTAANTQNPSVTNDYLIDALHSTLALTDATGTIQTTYAYEPYGATTQYGAATDNPYQYTGRENDLNSLYYYRNRYLLTVGAFTSEDPIGFAAGQNMFGYVQGDPIGFSDPLGLEPCPECALAGTIAGGVLIGTGLLIEAPIGVPLIIAGVGVEVFVGGHDAMEVIEAFQESLEQKQQNENNAMGDGGSEGGSEGSGGSSGSNPSGDKPPKQKNCQLPGWRSPPKSGCKFVSNGKGGYMPVSCNRPIMR